jgi:hypothetical protein
MRILALLFGGMAIAVYWAPLPAFIQSYLLVFTAVMCLAVRRAIERKPEQDGAAPRGPDAGQETRP